jgi:two-component system OmpR family response regulator
MSPARIMIVDGDEAIRDFMSMVLTDEGYEVHTVADTVAGLDSARTYRPDLLILDMPRIDHKSPQIVAAYRDKLPASTAMFVLSTSPAVSSDLAGHLGVRICIPKPFDIGDLLTCVEQNLPY